MYRLICQKPAHFLSAQMPLVSTFFQMFIVLGMYNFEQNFTLNSIVHWMSSALVSTSTIPFLTSLTWHSMAKAADCVARTSRQGARFRLMDVTTTDRKVPSSKGPKFRDMPSVIIPWLTNPPTLKLRKNLKLMLSNFDFPEKKYRERTITTRGLCNFYPIFEGQRRF